MVTVVLWSLWVHSLVTVVEGAQGLVTVVLWSLWVHSLVTVVEGAQGLVTVVLLKRREGGRGSDLLKVPQLWESTDPRDDGRWGASERTGVSGVHRLERREADGNGLGDGPWRKRLCTMGILSPYLRGRGGGGDLSRGGWRGNLLAGILDIFPRLVSAPNRQSFVVGADIVQGL